MFRGFVLLKVNMTLLELGCLLASAYLAYVYVMTKFWFANNIFALCFTVYCIENWLVGNFRNLFLIFLGLIAYDFSFVFHTDVMMTVAQGLDLPIKILIPRTTSF
jgi:minor histocompatibility antigen H13